MVALAIGSFLLLGAVQVFSNARAAYRTQVLITRLHENARYALAALEPDVRMAGFFGLTASAAGIDGRAGPAAPESLIPFARDCGPNWSLDLDRRIAAWNDTWSWRCRPRGRWADGSDSFVIRRVAAEPASLPLDPGTIYVQSERVGRGQLFLGASPPSAPAAAVYRIHSLVVSGYYVSENSVLDEPGNPMPSLRRKILRGTRIVDEEVMPGVEDMQVELGLDTDPPGSAGHGAVDSFANPGEAPALTAPAPDATVLALRIWLRVRAEAADRGFSDSRVYRYADRVFRPADTERGFRRVVVSKTIYLRNARTAL